MKYCIRSLFYSVCLLISCTTFGHQLSTSYINLNKVESPSKPNEFTGTWQIPLIDLEHKIAFDLNQDGNIAWYEITAKRAALNEFMYASIKVTSMDEQACMVQSNNDLKLDNHFNQPYVVLPININCAEKDAIILTYSAFFDIDANHKAITTVNSQTRVMSADEATQAFDFTSTSYLATFKQYVYQGILHIWMGLDHILFLIALLLTCVLVRKDNKWQGIDSKMAIFKHTAWIVTAFTLAHSITLTATAIDLLSANSRWVELGIAISVLFAALNNVWPVIIRLGWVTFAFGLLHGMGFASVLGELGLSSKYQLLSVLAFNLGVEIGQLAILVVALPVLIWARNHCWYQKWVMPAGSLIIAVIAVQWSIERV
ncbi:HupE/UreJ family protein [Pseudoalteromonas atlantica]|uniref:HupE/UreJ family protein n=1 Tax=Pseudoalteromonas atlantica TaxID=288 RepID=UPI0037363DE4